MKKTITKIWLDKYKLAKAYFKHHGNLEVPTRFKTKNGYTYNEKGVALGAWIAEQRYIMKGKRSVELNEDRIKLLEEIGMRFETKKIEEEWMYKYNLAKAYFEHHGNIEIPQSFKTTNGYEYDEDGLNLGTWITTQRRAYNEQGTNKISQEQIDLLNELGMRFETRDNEEEWHKKYNLAKAYYEHHNNLEIPLKFKTINGYEYDENGVALGTWIAVERQIYNGKRTIKVKENHVKLLEKIGMRFENKNNEEEWLKKYNLAKVYYEHNGNLKVPQGFKTKNGYDYNEEGFLLGNWISNQRQAYKGHTDCKLTEKQVKLLEDIKMKWYSEKIDSKYQTKKIDESNTRKKQIEILNRVRSFLNGYDEKTLPTKEEINNGLVDELNHKRNK